MTFPFDARYQTFAPLQQVPSAYLNSQQDATLTTYRGATAVVGANGMTVERGDWVCDGVNDQVEIQAAIAWVAAQGGGTVMLTAGTFDIQAMIDIPEKILLVGAGAGTILLINSAVATDFNVIEIDGVSNAGCWNFAIDGNIVGGHGHFHTGVSVRGAAAGTVLERLYLRNFAISGGLAYGRGIEVIGTSSRTRIVNSTFYNCENDGILVSSTASPHMTSIVGNIIRGCGQGMQIFNGSFVAIGNTIYNCDYGAILGTGITGAFYGQFLGNSIYTAATRGIGVKGLNCIISGNMVKDSGGYGIFLESDSYSSVHGNQVIGSGTAGIYMDQCDCTAVDENHIQDSSQAAANTHSNIYINQGANPRVTNNKFSTVSATMVNAHIESNAAGSGAALVSGNDCRANIGGGGARILDTFNDMVTTPYYTWDGAAHNINDVQNANRVS